MGATIIHQDGTKTEIDKIPTSGHVVEIPPREPGSPPTVYEVEKGDVVIIGEDRYLVDEKGDLVPLEVIWTNPNAASPLDKEDEDDDDDEIDVSNIEVHEVDKAPDLPELTLQEYQELGSASGWLEDALDEAVGSVFDALSDDFDDDFSDEDASS